MTSNSEFEHIASAWLADGPAGAADRAVEAALERIHATRQQRFGAFRRSVPTLTGSGWLAVAAVTTLVVTGSGLLVMRPAGGSGGAGPASSPTPTVTATPLVMDVPKPGANMVPGRYNVLPNGPVGKYGITFVADDGWHVVATNPTALAIAKDVQGVGTNAIQVSFEQPTAVNANPCRGVPSPATVTSAQSVPEFVTALRRVSGGWNVGTLSPTTLGTRGVLVDAIEFDLSWAQPTGGPACSAGATVRLWDSAVIDSRLQQHLIMFDMGDVRVLIDYSVSTPTPALQQEVQKLISSVSLFLRY